MSDKELEKELEQVQCDIKDAESDTTAFPNYHVPVLISDCRKLLEHVVRLQAIVDEHM